MRRTDNVCVTGSSKSAEKGGALMDDGSHTPHAFDALLRCRERLDQAVVAPIAKRSKLDKPMAVSARPNLAMCWAQRRPPATTAPSESPDESDLESELHIDLDRGCSATPDPPEPRTPPIDGGAISKSAFNSGRAAGMRVSPSCMNSLW